MNNIWQSEKITFHEIKLNDGGTAKYARVLRTSGIFSLGQVIHLHRLTSAQRESASRQIKQIP